MRVRSAARRAGGWRSRCAPCNNASPQPALPLLLRRGPAAKIIAELARATGADAVFWNEIAQAPELKLAGQVEAALKEIGVASHSFPGDLLAAPASHP